MLISSLLFLALGAIFGSFLANYTYRVIRGKDMGGRSVCDHCEKTIKAVDNIPILSYFLLGGKSRCCKKKLSVRYPLIEATCALGFVLVYQLSINQEVGPLEMLTGGSLVINLIILLFLFLTTFAIFIVDLEHQIIPDEIVFTIFFAALALLVIGHPFPYIPLTISFAAGSFFLFLNLITKGRGMGLGDAKLAVALGLILGTLTLVWIALSFVLGAIIGIILLTFGKAKLGKHIAFGPYMILAFWLVLIYSEQMQQVFLPYLW